MKICGIIAEYNPFHNGHLYQLKKAKELTGADCIITVMSGDFTERGCPAIIDKYERTKEALYSGSDLVLELPAMYAVSSAETFASGAVNLLDKLGAVSSLSFGLEDDDLSTLEKIAGVLNEEPDDFKRQLDFFLKRGLSFPLSRAKAVEAVLKDDSGYISDVLNKPNNILGIEYLRALKKTGSKIIPFGIKRIHAGYNSLIPENGFSSASYIRKVLTENSGTEEISSLVPDYVYSYLKDGLNKSFPVTEDDFSMLLQYLLEEKRDCLEDYLDFSSDMADKIRKALPEIHTFNGWAEILKSKNYTLSRIKRALLHVLLGIKTKDFEHCKNTGYVSYARILGFKKDSVEMFKTLSRETSIPLISKMADAKSILSHDALKLLETDIKAANLYRSAVYMKYNVSLSDEYTSRIVKI